MNSLYTEIILEHNKSKHNKRELESPDAVERGHNPNCGDDLTLQLNVHDGIIIDAAYIGSGCAISQASMSIMIDLVKGLEVNEAKEKAVVFFKMVRGHELTEDEEDLLEDATLFESLNKMPARAKCGTLSWHCLDVGLNQFKVD
ncbi:MAG: SUF system NifU family Fe-S cluster assembly protein [Clostridiales bacterium]|nr:SUF system NifU family Fe-S cluster assembly protein [Clostridiales bacterium]